MKENRVTFINLSELSYQNFLQLAKFPSTVPSNPSSTTNHQELLERAINQSKDSYHVNGITKNSTMKWYEELVVFIILALGVPGSVFTIPIIVIVIGLLTGSILRSVILSLLFLAPLAILPAPFYESFLSSWISFQILRYFSFKVIYEEKVLPNQSRILVAPPHGVFPIGNILTMIAFPSIMGFPFRGLGATAALKTPIFRQLLATIGVIDAGRSSAIKALKQRLTIGISTGGVAEVFETNSSSGDEVVVLKNRKGLVKLAFQTGADIIPCYLFGNTHLYDLFTGGVIGHRFFRNLSRKVGFALILFWGRWFLPIPYRVPILGVMGKAIKVPKNESPSDEDINRIHEQMLHDMMVLFDKYKVIYGWESKRLIIE